MPVVDIYKKLEELERRIKKLEKLLKKIHGKEITYSLFDNIMVTDLGLSVRANNAFLGAGIKTIEDLTEKKRIDLLKMRNIGKKTLEEIRKALYRYGLKLKGE